MKNNLLVVFALLLISTTVIAQDQNIYSSYTWTNSNGLSNSTNTIIKLDYVKKTYIRISEGTILQKADLLSYSIEDMNYGICIVFNVSSEYNDLFQVIEARNAIIERYKDETWIWFNCYKK